MKTAKTITSVTFLTLGVILIVGSMKYLQLAFRLLDESDVTYALMHALPTEYTRKPLDYWLIPKPLARYYLRNTGFASFYARKDADRFLLSMIFDQQYIKGASSIERIEMADALRENGFSVTGLDAMGCDAVHDAVMGGNVEALEYLIPLVGNESLRSQKPSKSWVCRENPIYVACRLYAKQGKPEHLKAWQMLYQKVNEGKLPASPLTREIDCSVYASL